MEIYIAGSYYNDSLLLFQASPCMHVYELGECMALWGEPNEPSIQDQVYIFMQCVDIAS